MTVYLVAFQKNWDYRYLLRTNSRKRFHDFVLLRYSLKNIQIKRGDKLTNKFWYTGTSDVFGIGTNHTKHYRPLLRINYYATAADVGLYSYGFKIANVLSICFVTSINFAIQPIMFQMIDKPNNKEFYSQLMTYYVLVVMFIGFCIMVLEEKLPCCSL